jgi:hypothetical protein
MKPEDQPLLDAIDLAQNALNEALFHAASAGILTRLETGTSAIRHQVSQNWVKVAAWRKEVLRD